jgi:hypothetical protein
MISMTTDSRVCSHKEIKAGEELCVPFDGLHDHMQRIDFFPGDFDVDVFIRKGAPEKIVPGSGIEVVYPNAYLDSSDSDTFVHVVKISNRDDLVCMTTKDINRCR